MRSLAPLLGVALAACAPLVAAQDVTVPSYCTAGYTAGTDEVIFTVPYTYDQVLSIIGSFKNLTWSGNPDNTVTLNGTDNTVGTARTYNILGAHIIETIDYYSKPPAPGPYQEIHTTATFTIASANVTLYIPYDGTVVSSVCSGAASRFNFTAHYCASNGAAGGQVLHTVHMNDAVTVGKFLGGRNFTSCAAALGAGNGSTPTTTGPPAVFTADAGRTGAVSKGLTGVVVGVLAVIVALLI